MRIRIRNDIINIAKSRPAKRRYDDLEEGGPLLKAMVEGLKGENNAKKTNSII